VKSDSLSLLADGEIPMREIIFDTETTGLSARDGDRIIEIGAIEMINRIPTGQTFHEYLNPGDRDVHPDAEKIHGISNADLVDKPNFEDVLPKFKAFFGEGTLIAHNASFDIGFFNAELKRVGEPAISPERVVDTLEIARRKFPAGPNSLDMLCKRFGISNTHRTLHGALLDSELLADVYIELTGGRQTDLSFVDHDSQNPQIAAAVANKPQRQRATPLEGRLSQAEREAHGEMIEAIGEGAIWKRWLQN